MATASRMPLIDALKAVASQLVLLHHMALYGPLAVAVAATFPEIAEWLTEYGRMAVQVFLVVGGFLAARSLSPAAGALRANPLPLIGRRYLRLVLPFMVAISLAVAVSALANQWLDDPAVPEQATPGQWLAHALLVHGVLGSESLSAGVWYVAIDFQLFALLALLLWLGRNRAGALLAVLGLAIISLVWFNRDSSLDNWAIYFFGSYGLGAAAWWASTRPRAAGWLLLAAVIGGAALLVDFRPRIAIALAVALLLGGARLGGQLERWPASRVPAFLGRISYAVFLVHFPVLLLINALFAAHPAEDPAAVAWWVMFAWVSCLWAGLAFHRWVELPLGGWRFVLPASLRVRRGRGNSPALPD